MDLLFASNNRHKIDEILALLPGTYRIITLQEAGILEEIPEPGTTIAENSFLKAGYVRDLLKRAGKAVPLVFADDSGLEVEALQGAPGVYSARYAGAPKSDAANNKKLLEALSAENNRRARFVTVITLLVDEAVHVFEGEVKGTIALQEKGDSGFGYDPLFIPEGYSESFAELGSEIKNKISHRAAAVKQLVQFLTNS